MPETETDIRLARLNLATYGPLGRYGAVLFVEKEGFASIFAAARLQERFDIGLMSTKGMSVIAARRFVDALAERGVRTLAIRDFDVTGFTIAGTLRADTSRYSFSTEGAIDLGLRLDDVEALGLAPEHVFHHGPGGERLSANQARAKIGPTLRKYGATEAEVVFLATHRVELNAMPSDVLVAWIEGKLAAAGVGKVVPEPDDLEKVARNYAVIDRANEILASADLSLVAVPPGQELEAALRQVLKARPWMPWDAALRQVLDEMKGE